MEGKKQRSAISCLIDFLLKLEILLEKGSRSGECDIEDERRTLRTHSNTVLSKAGLSRDPVATKCSKQ